ncbi:MAG: hypothetical protein HGA76_00280 [Candidatus Firestonebacteria bacterium]|nr:hypothetical protein [Candidatus Firestonebacteria bacterium]
MASARFWLAAVLAVGWLWALPCGADLLPPAAALPAAGMNAGSPHSGNSALRPGLSCYEPAYFGFIGWKPGSAPTRELECYIPFQVSMQYPLVPLNLDLFGEWKYPEGKLIDQDRSALYFVYNGRYDFFMYGRYSAPVVSRRQNPGAYFDFAGFLGGPDVACGYFHESNGQDIETREAYQARQAKDGQAQDFVSRGWDYWLYGAKKRFLLPDDLTPAWVTWINQQPLAWLNEHLFKRKSSGGLKSEAAAITLGAQFLFFRGEGLGGRMEEDDFWDESTVTPIHRSDYDGIRVSGVLESEHWRVSETVRWGYTNGRYPSSDFSLTCKLGGWLPLSLHWFDGYGPDLTTYHVRSNSVLLGLEFAQ